MTQAEIDAHINSLIVTNDETKQALIDAGVKNPTEEDIKNLQKAQADAQAADAAAKVAAADAAAKAAAAVKAAAAKAAADKQTKVNAIQMGVASLLPQIQSAMTAAQQPAPVPQEVVKTTDPFSFENPLDFGYFGKQVRGINSQKNTQNQDGTVKIASGGPIRGLPWLLRRRG
jgi:hypothetical protein